ncbi:MAG: hydantoinase/oxoprolinase family protein [Gemmatimonadales bacterium]
MVRVGVDVGGTFTDLVALADDGCLLVHKVVSTPQDPAIGLFRAVDLLRTPIDALIHGTTVATNALLERRGARVALVTTAGFEDLLWLRRQDRPALYDLARDHPPPLVERRAVVGVAERMGPEGVVRRLTRAEVTRVVAAVRRLRPEAVAVSLLFAFRHPAHERVLARALRQALPGVPVAASHEVLPVFREYERTSTTVAEAYLRPKVSAYLARAGAEVRRRAVGSLRIMASSGGTLEPGAAAARSAALALSGPAGGVVGARLVGEAVGRGDLLTLDMGGTSADASLVLDGATLSEGLGAVGGVPLALPAVLIETVSAGGGSLAWVDEGGALRVGPESAGAVPGPACYGRGGTAPTVTDACLVLGWLDPAQPLADEVRLDPAAAERALAPLGAATGRDACGVAAGIVDVATAVMARALKRVSVAQGIDPRRMALLPFGGAGPLFGCALADALGIATLVIPPHPGVLSALGLAAAAERVDLLASFHRPLARLDAGELRHAFQSLLQAGARELPGATLTRRADCRFAGQGYEVTVSVAEETPAAPAEIEQAFRTAHEARYGHAVPDQPVEVVNLHVVAERAVAVPRFGGRVGVGRPTPLRRKITVRGASATVPADVWPLGELPEGLDLPGPAILAGPDATALIEPGWRGRVHASGAVIVERRR